MVNMKHQKENKVEKIVIETLQKRKIPTCGHHIFCDKCISSWSPHKNMLQLFRTMFDIPLLQTCKCSFLNEPTSYC